MSDVLKNLAAVENKYDGRIPEDVRRAALKRQQEAWIDAHVQRDYYENLMFTEARKADDATGEALEVIQRNVEFYEGQAKIWRKIADAADWQNPDNSLAAAE